MAEVQNGVDCQYVSFSSLSSPTLFTINPIAVQERREIGRERQAAKLEVI